MQTPNKRKVNYSDIKTLYGHWEYFTVDEAINGKEHLSKMTSEMRFRYGKYVFYVNKTPSPVANCAYTAYHITCAVTGYSIAKSFTNDEGVLKQAFLERLNSEGFERYEQCVQAICHHRGIVNPFGQPINLSILTLLM